MRILDGKTSPAFWNNKGHQMFAVTIMAPLEVKVEDQFGDLIGDIYAGADITENLLPINQKLKTDSAYTDTVGQILDGAEVPPGTNIPNPFDPGGPDLTAAIWLGADPTNVILAYAKAGKFAAANIADVSSAVEVDKFTLLGGTGPRSALRKGTNIKIEWPP